MKDGPPWAEELLRTGKTAYLATADLEARPLGVVICYVFDGSVFYSVIDGKPKTTRRLRRLRNIEANPLVSLTVNHYDDDWTALRHVIVEGRAVVVESDEERAAALERLRDKYPQYARMDSERDFGTLFRIDPDRFVFWSASHL